MSFSTGLGLLAILIAGFLLRMFVETVERHLKMQMGACQITYSPSIVIDTRTPRETDWFRPEVKPVRDGLYKVRSIPEEPVSMGVWHKGQWYYDETMLAMGFACYFQDLEWCGLAEPVPEIPQPTPEARGMKWGCQHG
jgi:hypothetical protein